MSVETDEMETDSSYAVDAVRAARGLFLVELNTYYSLGLPMQGISPGKLRGALAARGRPSPELTALRRGTWQTALSDTEDRVRQRAPHHCASSSRRWTVQLRFILRPVDAFAAAESCDSVFGYLMETDFVDMLLLLERLNRAVHEPDAHIAEADLTLVLRRVMAFITLCSEPARRSNR
jgi:hypothetical protein